MVAKAITGIATRQPKDAPERGGRRSRRSANRWWLPRFLISPGSANNVPRLKPQASRSTCFVPALCHQRSFVRRETCDGPKHEDAKLPTDSLRGLACGLGLVASFSLTPEEALDLGRQLLTGYGLGGVDHGFELVDHALEIAS